MRGLEDIFDESVLHLTLFVRSPSAVGESDLREPCGKAGPLGTARIDADIDGAAAGQQMEYPHLPICDAVT